MNLVWRAWVREYIWSISVFEFRSNSVTVSKGCDCQEDCRRKEKLETSKWTGWCGVMDLWLQNCSANLNPREEAAVLLITAYSNCSQTVDSEDGIFCASKPCLLLHSDVWLAFFAWHFGRWWLWVIALHSLMFLSGKAVEKASNTGLSVRILIWVFSTYSAHSVFFGCCSYRTVGILHEYEQNRLWENVFAAYPLGLSLKIFIKIFKNTSIGLYRPAYKISDISTFQGLRI